MTLLTVYGKPVTNISECVVVSKEEGEELRRKAYIRDKRLKELGPPLG